MKKLKKLLDEFCDIEFSASVYDKMTTDTRFDTRSEFALSCFMRGTGYHIEKKENINIYDYDFDLILDSELVRLEIKSSSTLSYIEKFKNGEVPVKVFVDYAKFWTTDRRRYSQGNGWDISKQLNNPNGSELTLFFAEYNDQTMYKFELLGIMTNQEIIDNHTMISKQYNATSPIGRLKTNQIQ